MRTSDFHNPTFHRALVLGGLGGIALVLVEMFSNRGPLILLPYAALLAALAALVGPREPSFRTRFAALLAGFIVASLVLYLYVANATSAAASISVFGHIARLMFLLAIGSALAAAISYVIGRPARGRDGSAPAGDSSVAA